MFGAFFADQATPDLRDENLVLRAPRARDYDLWRAVRERSRDALKPFEPSWTLSDLDRRSFSFRLRTARKEAARGTEFLFFVFVKEGEREILVGGLTLSNIRRRAAQCANFGYWMDVEHVGQGLMSRAVKLAVGFCFGALDLHRINAACLLDNEASRRVLEKNGFREEGMAENFLRINGAWRDHRLFALTRERYDGTRQNG